MQRSVKEIIIRVIILFGGLIIAHLGVTLFLLANLGADPFNVLIQGLYRTIFRLTGWEVLTHGYVHMAVCFGIIIVLLIVDRRYIKIGTIICMICGGPIIDFFSWMLQNVINDRCSFPVRLITLGAGCIILAFGMTIVMKSDSGVGPNDLVAIVISDKLHRPFGMIRIIVDLSFVAAGFFLGGAVGIGTIICAGLVGPVAGVFLPHNEKLINVIIKKFE